MSELRRRMTEDLQLRGLSKRTQETYLRAQMGTITGTVHHFVTKKGAAQNG